MGAYVRRLSGEIAAQPSDNLTISHARILSYLATLWWPWFLAALRNADSGNPLIYFNS